MIQKFTSYCVTTLPATADRDTGGIYYLRTPTGFKAYIVSNTPTKDWVELDTRKVPYRVITGNTTIVPSDSTICSIGNAGTITISSDLTSPTFDGYVYAILANNCTLTLSGGAVIPPVGSGITSVTNSVLRFQAINGTLLKIN